MFSWVCCHFRRDCKVCKYSRRQRDQICSARSSVLARFQCKLILLLLLQGSGWQPIHLWLWYCCTVRLYAIWPLPTRVLAPSDTRGRADQLCWFEPWQLSPVPSISNAYCKISMKNIPRSLVVLVKVASAKTQCCPVRSQGACHITESLTTDHSESHVWRVSRSLQSEVGVTRSLVLYVRQNGAATANEKAWRAAQGR
jgi:hypothetical protein